MSKGIDVCAIQLPGREDRISETHVKAIRELVPEICRAIQPYLDVPYSFFGHSMGSLIAFEVARALRRVLLPAPEWILASGALAPHRRPLESLHQLPMKEFIASVAEIYTLPEELLSNPELLDVFGPILKSDFELVETYRFQPERNLKSKILAFGGSSDLKVPPSELQYWGDLTTKTEQFRVSLYEGDHFYLREQIDPLTSEIAKLL